MIGSEKIMKILRVCILVTLMGLLSCTGSDDGNEGCKNRVVNYLPTELTMEVDKGATIEFSGEGAGCDEEEIFTYRFLLSNSTVNEEQVSETNSYRFIACDPEVGSNRLVLEAKDDEGEIGAVAWQINVRDVTPDRPECYNPAMNSFKNGDFDGSKTGMTMEAAVECLHDWTLVYGCDAEAHFAAGLGKLVLFGDGVEEQIESRGQMTGDEVYLIFFDDVATMRTHMKDVSHLTDESFRFYIDYMLLHIFDGELDQLGNPIVLIDLSGEHDYTEVIALLGGLNWASAMGNMLRAYRGFVDFLIHLPKDFEYLTPIRWGEEPEDGQFYLENEMLKLLDTDPEFLLLRGSGGAEGAELLIEAREYYVEAFKLLNLMLDLGREETDDQEDDIFRYWDCGADAICPGDPAEPDLSGGGFDDKNDNGVQDPAHTIVGADYGEGNGVYDAGEPIGFDGIQWGREGVSYSLLDDRWDLPMEVNFIQNLLAVISNNLTSGEPLVLDHLLGEAYTDIEFDDSMIFAVLRALNVPVPEIRLAEFFDTPMEMRDGMPAYRMTNIAGETFYHVFYEREREAYQDVGLDGVRSGSELGYCRPITDGSDPEEICYHIGTSVICTTCQTEYCHQVDELADSGDYCADDSYVDRTPCEGDYYTDLDNDFDGEVDEFNRLGTSCEDSGPDGNLLFDYQDENGNGRQDSGEPCEPFADEGIGDNSGTANNGVRDEADMDHDWPTVTYATIAVPTRDPRDGLPNGDVGGELIDEYYFFLPDPTYSGLLTFSEEYVNGEGESLNENAKLMRFIWKALEQADLLVGGVGGVVGFKSIQQQQ
jgi:hypothetical protein